MIFEVGVHSHLITIADPFEIWHTLSAHVTPGNDTLIFLIFQI